MQENVYGYNKFSQLFERLFLPNSPGLDIEDKFFYRYPDHASHNPSSVTEINSVWNGIDSIRTTFEYDNQINPLWTVKSFDPTITPSNVIKEESTVYGSDGSITVGLSVSYTYVYNSSGYPISKTVAPKIAASTAVFVVSYSNL